MAKAEASVEELVGMIERGELRLPEMQRRYVWRSTRVRDLLDSLYRGYPSGAILLWETDEEVPLQEMAVSQQTNPYQSTRLLLDGQQRLTSLSAVIRGEPVKVRGRKKPIELLFNLDHPDQLAVVTEVDEDGDDEDDDDELIDDEADSSEDELQKRFDRMTFVVATRKLEQLPQWVKVTEVFKTDSDAGFLRRAGVSGFDDPNYERYSQRLARLRGIRKYVYRMDVLERRLSYDEVTEIFVRVNSLGAKLRSSDLALAQITAKWRNSLKTFEAFQQQCAKTGFELRSRSVPQEPRRLHHRAVALPHRRQPAARRVAGGVDGELPRHGVRAQLPEEQRGHRQPRAAVVAVHADRARLLRTQARLRAVRGGVRAAAVLGAGRQRQGALLARIERDAA